MAPSRKLVRRIDELDGHPRQHALIELAEYWEGSVAAKTGDEENWATGQSSRQNIKIASKDLLVI
jgi:hypothetical protein